MIGHTEIAIDNFAGGRLLDGIQHDGYPETTP